MVLIAFFGIDTANGLLLTSRDRRLAPTIKKLYTYIKSIIDTRKMDPLSSEKHSDLL